MKHVVEHDLDQATAKRATQKAWDTYSTKFADYDPKAHWTTDKTAELSFSAKGLRVKGKIELEPKGIAIDLSVPLLLRPFQAKAYEVITREIKKWVDKAKAGELDG
jgi:hypothetical protein